MTERELKTQSLNCLESKDYCANGKVDDRGSRLCRDNVSCRDDDCRECLKKLARAVK